MVNLRYTLHYINNHGKKDWMDMWHPTNVTNKRIEL